MTFVDLREVDFWHFGFGAFRRQEFQKVGEKVGLEDRVLDVRGCSLLSPGIGELLRIGPKAYRFLIDEYGQVSGFVWLWKCYSVVFEFLPLQA